MGEPKAEDDRAAQRDGSEGCHRSDWSPRWQQHEAGRASESEAPPLRPTFDPVQLAEHRVAPLNPLGREQSDRPPQEECWCVVVIHPRVQFLTLTAEGWRVVMIRPQVQCLTLTANETMTANKYQRQGAHQQEYNDHEGH